MKEQMISRKSQETSITLQKGTIWKKVKKKEKET